ncbi:unnamed protein product, partial [Ceratitis capitata]
MVNSALVASSIVIAFDGSVQAAAPARATAAATAAGAATKTHSLARSHCDASFCATSSV